MDNYNDINEYRKKRNRANNIKRVVLVTIIILLIISIIIVLNIFKNGNLLDIDNEKATFPISFNNEQMIDICSISNNMALLSRTGLITYSLEGKLNNTYVHGFSNPVMKEGSKRVLTYDRGGNKFRVDSNTGNVGGITADGSIITGAIASNGYIAIVTTSDRYASVITVYDSSLIEIYKYSSIEKINAIDFSDDNTKIAAASISNKDGLLSAKIYRIDTSSTAEAVIIEIDNILPLAVSFESDNKISVIGNECMAVVDENGSIVKYEYSGEIVGFETNLSNGVVLAINNMYSNNLDIVVINTKGEVECSDSINDEYADIYCDDSRILVLGQEKMYNYNVSMQKLNETVLDENYIKISYSGMYAYLISTNKCSRYIIE